MDTTYVTPDIGTVLPAMPNTNPDGTVRVPNPGPVQSEKGDGLNEWLQAQAQNTAYNKSAVLAQEYTAYFTDSWLVNYKDGKIDDGNPDAPPPQPPPAFIVLVIAAEAGGVTFDIQPSGQADTGDAIPVCDVPAYDKIPAPQHSAKKGKK